MTRHNHVAILVAVILHQVIGFLWYSNFLFVHQWMAGLGKKASDFDMTNPTPFIADIVGWFLPATSSRGWCSARRFKPSIKEWAWPFFSGSVSRCRCLRRIICSPAFTLRF